MNNQDLIRGIRRAWEIASFLRLGANFTNPAALQASDAFIEHAFDKSIRYEQLYLVGIENSDYNFTLSDYSFLQFGMNKNDHVRYAYYPNPFIGASPDHISQVSELRVYVEEGLISLEEFLQRISEIRSGRCPPLIRYENAPDQYKEFEHPCSHFHLGHHDENRWSVGRTLTPSVFLMLILKHFYSDAWIQSKQFKLFNSLWTMDKLLANDKNDCRLLSDEHFTINEKSIFSYT